MGHNVIIFLVVEVCQRGCVPQFENHCYRAWRQENLLGASPRPRFSRKFLLKGIRVEHNTQCQSHTHTHTVGESMDLFPILGSMRKLQRVLHIPLWAVEDP